MLDGGNAIDSSIATMYCNTVVNSQSMGIGRFTSSTKNSFKAFKSFG